MLRTLCCNPHQSFNMKKQPARPLFPVRERAQIEALASPARQEVADGLQAIGPCSIADLADLLGRAPDSLYYHVRKLEKVGLVVARGTRETGVLPGGLKVQRCDGMPCQLINDHPIVLLRKPGRGTERSVMQPRALQCGDFQDTDQVAVVRMEPPL